MNERSLLDDEFHRAARRIVARAPVANPIRSIPSVGLLQVSDGLRDNRMSGREKVTMERTCRICPEGRDLTRHHLVPHAWFLSGQGARLKSIRNANANIVPLCVSCHRIVDGVHDPVGRLQKRAALRASLGTNEVSFILQVMGPEWFEENYPRNP